MKTNLQRALLPLILSAASCHAQGMGGDEPMTPAMKQAQLCTNLANQMQSMAVDRYTGATPQQAYAHFQSQPWPQKAAPKTAKKMINMVYFDPELKSLLPNVILNVAFQACFNPPARYEPLR